MTRKKTSSFTVSLVDAEQEFDTTTHDTLKIQTALKIFCHPDFCVVDYPVGKRTRKVLINRDAISSLDSDKLINESTQPFQTANSTEDIGRKGLYIHKSVLENLDVMIRCTKNIDEIAQVDGTPPYFETTELKAAESIRYHLSVGIDLLGEDTTYTALCHWK